MFWAVYIYLARISPVSWEAAEELAVCSLWSGSLCYGNDTHVSWKVVIPKVADASRHGYILWCPRPLAEWLEHRAEWRLCQGRVTYVVRNASRVTAHERKCPSLCRKEIDETRKLSQMICLLLFFKLDLFYEVIDKQVIAYQWSPQGTYGVQILPKYFRHRRPSVWQDSNPRFDRESSTLTTLISAPPQMLSVYLEYDKAILLLLLCLLCWIISMFTCLYCGRAVCDTGEAYSNTRCIIVFRFPVDLLNIQKKNV